MTFRRRTQQKLGLLARSRTSPSVFADFYTLTCESIFAYFVREVRDEQTALDLVGETFAIAFAKRGDFRGSDDRQGAKWLWKIAYTTLAMYRRSNSIDLAMVRRLGWERELITDSDQRELELMSVQPDIVEHLNAALDRLPADQRQVISLRFDHELSYSEIASELGVTSDVARTRASRGLRALRSSHHADEIMVLRRT
jgi:RNA polymerase sigma-70 factor (ECF subfamily)